MSDVQLTLLLRAHTEEARAKIRQAAKELEKFGGVSTEVGRKAVPPLDGVGRSSTLAAGSVANLAAQFNDIGIMMAAGQNPLQLALQQGTQISQVIGPMGAAGAVKALGAAFLSLLNPVTLVTVGSIAAGAAMTKWLTRSKDASAELEKRMEALRDQVKAFEAANKSASRSSREMVEEYGALAASAAEVLEINRRLAELRAQEELSATMRGLADGLGIGGILDLSTEELADISSAIAALREERRKLDVSLIVPSEAEFDRGIGRFGEITERIRALKRVLKAPPDLADIFAIEESEAEEIVSRFTEIGEADGPRRQAEAMISLAQYISEVSDGLASAKEEGEALYEQLVQSAMAALNLARVQAADQIKADNLVATLRQENAIREAILAHGEDSSEVEALRLSLARELFQVKLATLNIDEAEKAKARALWEQKQALAAQERQAEDKAAAEAWLTDLQTENTIRKAILDHGEDSVEVAELRADAERRSFEEMLATLDVSAELKAKLRGAFEAGLALSNLDLGKGVRGALAEDPVIRFADLQRKAEEIMATLDQAVAAINEKVRAGLMSTAEGVQAIARAKDRAGAALAELIPQLDAAAEAAGPKGAPVVAQWREELRELAKDMDQARADLSQSLSGAFADGLGDVLSQTQEASAAVGNMVDAIQRHIARMVADRFTSAFITPMLDSLLTFLPFAAGGVPGGASLADQRDTVDDTPIVFGMGSGRVGVAREAGKEAILPVRPAGGKDGVLAVGPDGQEGTLPLTRTAGGALGVALVQRPVFFARGGVVGGSAALASAPTSGPGGQPGNVQVNVHNNGGGEATVQERQEGDTRIVDVLIERVEAGIAGNVSRNVGPLSGVLGSSFGLRRTPR